MPTPRLVLNLPLKVVVKCFFCYGVEVNEAQRQEAEREKTKVLKTDFLD